jgi:acetate kinase
VPLGHLIAGLRPVNYTGPQGSPRPIPANGSVESGARDALPACFPSEDFAIVTNPPGRTYILTVNGGSSSLKFAIFERDCSERAGRQRLWSGSIERIGLPDAHATVIGPGEIRETWPAASRDLGEAAGRLIDWLEKHELAQEIAAVGHRIVHGGPRFHQPEAVTGELVAELRRLIPLDVDHLPGEIAVIECFQRRLPAVPQVACFDTGFHHEMPRVARIVPVPRRFEASGVRRYGFHGLSYAYLMEELGRTPGATASGRVILAHLGSGASLAAVSGGKSVDTTMGFTPASGLVMGTRPGDLDPGLPWFLCQSAGMTVQEFHSLVNHQSGLLGISETSPDFRDLLAREGQDRRAAEALAVFVYQAKKGIGALAAVLGGLDVLVFSGGIGENSPVARARICEGLEFLGIVLDHSRNHAGAPLISHDQARPQVRVIRTDEESMIARAAAAFLSQAASRREP